MRLFSIASGSSGNCIYVGNENSNLLVDVGISMKRIKESLECEGFDFEKIHGILITHEHSDHVSGLGPILRKYSIPVYGTEETIDQMFAGGKMGKVKEELFHCIEPDRTFQINDITVNPFSISHDAINPVCYTFHSNGHKVGVATDMGKYDDYIISHLKESEILLLEANHDINMLQVGSYPYSLKKRVLGDKGHLSNDNSGRLICELYHEKLQYIFLGHLSQENNYPDLAYQTVKYELEKESIWKKLKQDVMIANRCEPSCLVSV